MHTRYPCRSGPFHQSGGGGGVWWSPFSETTRTMRFFWACFVSPDISSGNQLQGNQSGVLGQFQYPPLEKSAKYSITWVRSCWKRNSDQSGRLYKVKCLSIFSSRIKTSKESSFYTMVPWYWFPFSITFTLEACRSGSSYIISFGFKCYQSLRCILGFIFRFSMIAKPECSQGPPY